MKIKVCAMRNSENIQGLIALEPDFMGFIFYDKSKRFVCCRPNSSTGGYSPTHE